MILLSQPPLPISEPVTSFQLQICPPEELTYIPIGLWPRQAPSPLADILPK